MDVGRDEGPVLVVTGSADDAEAVRRALGPETAWPVAIDCVEGVAAMEARLARHSYQAILLCADDETSPGPARIRQLCAGREPPPIIALVRNVDGPRADVARSEGVDQLIARDELSVPRLATALHGVAALRSARRLAIGADRRWRRLFDNVPVGLFELDGRGRLLRVNPALLEMLGDDDLKALRQRLRDERIFADRRQRLHWLRAIAAGKTIRDLELTLNHRSGAILHVIAGCAPVRDQRGLLGTFEGTVTDVTRLKELGQQFLLAQKMEAVGQMTGGIAHDFSNLLTIILGNLYLMEKELDPANPAAATLAATRKAARQGADLTRRLLAFARQEPLEPELVDLDARLEDLRPLIERTVDGTARLSLRPSGEHPRVRVDPVQLESAIINLAVNARDAMPDGGELTIAVDATTGGEGWHRITVADTGVGLASEAREHLFEPFFTTKEHGNGLGLAMVQTFVRGADGRIEVDSEPGRGTTFRILLPAASA